MCLAQTAVSAPWSRAQHEHNVSQSSRARPAGPCAAGRAEGVKCGTQVRSVGDLGPLS